MVESFSLIKPQIPELITGEDGLGKQIEISMSPPPQQPPIIPACLCHQEGFFGTLPCLLYQFPRVIMYLKPSGLKQEKCILS